ncbi:MAG: hypothetical protein ABUT20_02500 [Bacteroidota bacterium]
MKKTGFLFLVLVPFLAIGQSSPKIFAYSQELTPGTIPKGVSDENGNSIKTRKESAVNYYIFAAHPASEKISFAEIWINGKFYSIQTHKVDSTPVVNVNKNIPGSPVKEILVPYTKLKVTSITPVAIIESTLIRKNWFRQMTLHNELIVSYMSKGKKYFQEVKKIKILEHIAGE